jgi:shikimate dehydrogenase
VYVTFPQDITPQQYAVLLRSPITRGGAVTGRGGIKSTIIPFLDGVEPLTHKTLAVNTVINKNGKLSGYNTDSHGLKTALQKSIENAGIKIKNGIVYNNGGVSGVAYRVLQDLGIRVTMVGRDNERVLKKKKELGVQEIPHFKGPYDLVVDATPVSADPDFLTNARGYQDVLRDCKMVFCHSMPELVNKKNYLKAYCDTHTQHIFYSGKTHVHRTTHKAIHTVPCRINQSPWKSYNRSRYYTRVGIGLELRKRQSQGEGFEPPRPKGHTLAVTCPKGTSLAKLSFEKRKVVPGVRVKPLRHPCCTIWNFETKEFIIPR